MKCHDTYNLKYVLVEYKFATFFKKEIEKNEGELYAYELKHFVIYSPHTWTD